MDTSVLSHTHLSGAFKPLVPPLIRAPLHILIAFRELWFHPMYMYIFLCVGVGDVATLTSCDDLCATSACSFWFVVLVCFFLICWQVT